MKILGVIPARLASSRFPNKPLTDLLGIPMIGHVFFRSQLSKRLSALCVATCDEGIRTYVEGVGGSVVMTSDKHNRASERTAEALLNFEESTGVKYDYVLMIQGDLPLLMPDAVDAVASVLDANPTVEVVDTIARIRSQAEFENPNNVKVVMDLQDYAMYYSREPIPSRKKHEGEVPMWRQPGLIMFRRDVLQRYVALAPTPLEIIESVDMNRLLEHGIGIKFVRSEHAFESIDVPSDSAAVLEGLSKDPYFDLYKRKR